MTLLELVEVEWSESQWMSWLLWHQGVWSREAPCWNAETLAPEELNGDVPG